MLPDKRKKMIYIRVIFAIELVVAFAQGFSEVCFGDFGCFTDGPPFGGTSIRIKGYLPDEPSKVYYFLSLIYLKWIK